MPISKKLLNALLKGCERPEDLLGEAGLLATLPLVRPLARGLRRGGTRLVEAAIRRRPAHRRHDARQHAILAAFEAETARLAPPPDMAGR